MSLREKKKKGKKDFDLKNRICSTKTVKLGVFTMLSGQINLSILFKRLLKYHQSSEYFSSLIFI